MRNRSCVYDALDESHFICLKLQQFFYDRHLKAIKFKVEHLCCYWTLVNLYAQRNIEITFPVIAWLSPLSLCKAIFYALVCAKCKKKAILFYGQQNFTLFTNKINEESELRWDFGFIWMPKWLMIHSAVSVYLL